jgi:hypothetical protein
MFVYHRDPYIILPNEDVLHIVNQKKRQHAGGLHNVRTGRMTTRNGIMTNTTMAMDINGSKKMAYVVFLQDVTPQKGTTEHTYA